MFNSNKSFRLVLFIYNVLSEAGIRRLLKSMLNLDNIPRESCLPNSINVVYFGTKPSFLLVLKAKNGQRTRRVVELQKIILKSVSVVRAEDQ